MPHACSLELARPRLVFPIPQLIGNGDIFSYTDWNAHMEAGGGRLTTCMIGRGALIKPWLFTEIKEQRHWDISASVGWGWCKGGMCV